MYKHALERNGVRIAVRAVKTRGSTIRSFPMPQGVGSPWLKPPRRWARGSRETRHDGRRLGSFLLSLLRERRLSERGERWDDPGQAGETDHAHRRRCTGRQLPVGLEPTRWCPRTTRDVRGRDDFGEGSSSRRIGTTKREGSASRTPRGVAVPQSSGTVPEGRAVTSEDAGKRVHRGRIGRSGRKRIAAPPLPGSGRANGTGPG